MKIYLVGGAVRDTLLQLPVTDQDWVVVGSTVQEMLQHGYQQVGKDFPVFLHPETHEEYALARTERKSGRGYTGFSCYAAPDVTLEQDLQRRDLTINAIAQDKAGNYIDPWNGRADIKQRLLRHVSPAFAEDPLRVLRVARFAARFALLGFQIAPETKALMEQITDSGELSSLTAERIWGETEKALQGPCPQLFFQTLRNCGALSVLFPELDQLFGVPAPEKWHPEVDSGVHSLLALTIAAQLSPEVEVRFAALCHDIGKGVTPKEVWPRHPNHGVAGIALIEAISQRLRIPNAVRDIARLVAEYHDLVHICDHQPAHILLQLFDHIDVWRRPHRLVQLVLASEADYRGRSGWENYPYLQGEYLKRAYEIVKQVDHHGIIADGFRGAAIGKALYQHRLSALTAWQRGEC